MRPPDTFQRDALLSALSPVERYSWDGLLAAGRLAQWLRKPVTTINRWGVRNGFPRPAGRIPSRKGSRGRHTKGLRGWRAADVLRWLEHTGRLEA